jgi:eukaryotic-like serine/threonine-protein kinase
MSVSKVNAAEQLLGLKLDGGWRVIEKLKKSEKGSGGVFSFGYKVEREGKIAFLKAFDFSSAFVPPRDPIQELPKLISTYTHERDLLKECGDKKLSNVAIAIDGGRVSIIGMGEMEGTAYYLIFEIADGDVRVQMDVASAGDIIWTTGVIQGVALGLFQVHRQMIAHQDVKPSNVLLYNNKISKIADLGRASKKGRDALHDVMHIPGDRTYAPHKILTLGDLVVISICSEI